MKACVSLRINGEPAHIEGDAPLAAIPMVAGRPEFGSIMADRHGINCAKWCKDGAPVVFADSVTLAMLAADTNRQVGA